MTDTGRYPAVAYEREIDEGWNVSRRDLGQIEIGAELMSSVNLGLPVQGGPLRTQLPDGSQGQEDGAVSIVWSRMRQDDGSRKVLAWYESSRGVAGGGQAR